MIRFPSNTIRPRRSNMNTQDLSASIPTGNAITVPVDQVPGNVVHQSEEPDAVKIAWKRVYREINKGMS